jgi:5-methyltetrahydrofolate--homocysteine methyltransferase
MSKYEDLISAVISGQQDKVITIVQGMIENDTDYMEIIEEGLNRGMAIVGEKLNIEEMFIPEVLIAADAMKAGMEILKPLILGDKKDFVFQGKVIIGTVKGDLHNIGKNIVSLMLESVGFEVMDMGEDVPEERFVKAIEDERPDILGLSTLMTTTMGEMRKIIKTLHEKNLRSAVKVMIGGAPINQNYADKIGADMYAPDANSAAKKAGDLL